MKPQLSTPQKIEQFFIEEIPPSGSHLDEQILTMAFGAMKKRYHKDYGSYIIYSAKRWAERGGSKMGDLEIAYCFRDAEPDPVVKKVKADKFAGMEPIPFDPEWIDCGGPDAMA